MLTLLGEFTPALQTPYFLLPFFSPLSSFSSFLLPLLPLLLQTPRHHPHYCRSELLKQCIPCRDIKVNGTITSHKAKCYF